MKGNKCTVVLTQIVASLKESKDAISTAQMFVKLMNKGVHQNADIVGMVMAQLSLVIGHGIGGKDIPIMARLTIGQTLE